MSDSYRFPDFVIAGAMKAGTTSLHHILAHHEDVFLPEEEIFFFDLDDAEQHPDFSVDERGRWFYHDYEGNYEEYLAWYSTFFADSKSGQIVGDDSTTYMASSRAPARIAGLLPNVRLIFMLRDPVTRAYSHYWHLVRTGRAVDGFEDTLRRSPGTIIQRGFYRDHAERYQRYFRPEQMKFIIFEHFVKNVQSVVDDVCSFLGLRGTVETRNIDKHQHAGTTARSLRLKLAANRLLGAPTTQYRGYLPTPGSNETKKLRSRLGRHEKHLSPSAIISRAADLVPRSKYAPMSDDVREYLQKLYARENTGLGELISMDIDRYWPYMERRREGPRG